MICTHNPHSNYIIRRLWKDTENIIIKKNWKINAIMELITDDYDVLGRCKKFGELIYIEVRFVDSNNRYYSYYNILDTFIHELSHIVYNNHSTEFYNLMTTLLEEIDIYNNLPYKQITVYQTETPRICDNIKLRYSILFHDCKKGDIEAFIKNYNILNINFSHKYIYYDLYIKQILNILLKYNHIHIVNKIIEIIGLEKFNALYEFHTKTYLYRKVLKTKIITLKLKEPNPIAYDTQSLCIVCIEEKNTTNYYGCSHYICKECVNICMTYSHIICPICKKNYYDN